VLAHQTPPSFFLLSFKKVILIYNQLTLWLSLKAPLPLYWKNTCCTTFLSVKFAAVGNKLPKPAGNPESFFRIDPHAAGAAPAEE